MPKWLKVAPNLNASYCHSQVGEALVVCLQLGPSGLQLCYIYGWINPADRCQSFCLAGVTKLEEGAVTLGMVAHIDPRRGLLVQLPFGGMGIVAVTDLADAYRPNPFDGYKNNQIVRSVS